MLARFQNVVGNVGEVGEFRAAVVNEIDRFWRFLWVSSPIGPGNDMHLRESQ